MGMRKYLIPIITAMLLSLAVSAQSAPPTPGGMGIVNPSFTNNVVLTNVAVSMPVGTWTNATIYAPALTLKQGIQFAWTASAGAAGYAVYYSTVSGTVTRFDVGPNIGVVFFGLTVGTPYYIYVTAYDASHNESPPSAIVLFQPGS